MRGALHGFCAEDDGVGLDAFEGFDYVLGDGFVLLEGRGFEVRVVGGGVGVGLEDIGLQSCVCD